jgi:hypothetical protein
MATEYTVGLRLEGHPEVFTIEAEDALGAALKAKHEYPHRPDEVRQHSFKNMHLISGHKILAGRIGNC